MNDVSESKNEKDKKIKKASETYSYEDYENAEMENTQESFGMEEGSEPETGLSSNSCPPFEITPIPKSETVRSEESYFEKRKRLLEEKWKTVTGKKPRNIPNVKQTYLKQKFIPFGERRQREVESKAREKWMHTFRKLVPLIPNHGKLRHEIMMHTLFEGVMSVRYNKKHPDLMALGCRNGEIQIVKPSTAEVTQSLKTIEQVERMPLRTVCFHSHITDRLYAAGSAGIVQAFDVPSGKTVGTSKLLGNLYNLCVNANGRFVITTGRNGKVCVVDAETLELLSFRTWPDLSEASIATAQDHYHQLRVYGLQCHPTDPNVFATSGWDGTLKIWDVREQAAIKSIRGPAVFGDGVDISDEKIVTASWRPENSLSLWSLSSGRLIKNVPIKTSKVFENEFLYAVKFFKEYDDVLNNDFVAVGGSGFPALYVINTITNQVIASLPSYKAILCLDTNNNQIAYGGKETLFRIGQVTTSKMK